MSFVQLEDVWETTFVYVIEAELLHSLGTGKHNLYHTLSVFPFTVITQSAVSSLKLLTKLLKLIRAAAGVQWKKFPLRFPPPHPRLMII